MPMPTLLRMQSGHVDVRWQAEANVCPQHRSNGVRERKNRGYDERCTRQTWATDATMKKNTPIPTESHAQFMAPYDSLEPLRLSVEWYGGEAEGGEAWLVHEKARLVLRYVQPSAERSDDVTEAQYEEVHLVSADELRYAMGARDDELILPIAKFRVPKTHREKVRSALALERIHARSLRADAGPDVEMPFSRYIDGDNAIHRGWLRHNLEVRETVLAWLETDEKLEVSSSLGQKSAVAFFLLTERRCALVAISALGDSTYLPLSGESWSVRAIAGREKAVFDDVTFSSANWGGKRFQEIFEAIAYKGAARILEVARCAWINGKAKSDECLEVRRFLANADPQRVPPAFLLRESLENDENNENNENNEFSPSDDARLQAMSAWADRRLVLPGAGRVFRAWHLPLRVGKNWLRLARDNSSRIDVEFALELHALLRETLLAEAGDDFECAAIDVDYAEHLVETGRTDDAMVVLESRLSALPSEELRDLLPSVHEDLTAREAGQRYRVKLLETMSHASGNDEQRRAQMHLELAKLEPLVPSRLHAVSNLGRGHVQNAAHQVLSILEPGGLLPFSQDLCAENDDTVRPFGSDLLFSRLQHPAAREGHVLGVLQRILGGASVPDHGALQDYCERLSRDSIAQRALSDATVGMGAAAVAGFVSRGEKAVGVRAYESAQSFLLVGGAHLEETSAFQMHPWELRFAIASEIAHLKFRHTRLTRDEIWTGAVAKGRFGMEMVVGILPVLKGVDLIDKLWKIIDGYQKGPLGKVMRGVDIAEKAVQKVRGPRASLPANAKEKMVAPPNEHLVAAHRVMQLTADRAGLLFAKDLGAAIRSMFLVSHDYVSELPTVERYGLLPSLSRRGEGGDILFQDLAIRIAALIGFYLSDDYLRLREALWKDA